MADHLYAVIMAGGRGTRFWPRSRKRNAKQVLRFFGERSLVQQTVDRLKPIVRPDKIWIFTNELLEAEIRRQLPEVPKQQVIAEPSQRNTAPCIALAAKILADIDGKAVMGVFPADHLILKEARFREFVKSAFRAAEQGEVVILGIQPRWAETGYGYIEFPENVEAGGKNPVPVMRFREKPDERTAKTFVKSGNFFWNAGMFFWRAGTVLELMRHHQPKTAMLLAGLPPFRTKTFMAKLRTGYPLCEDISVDYAIFEHAEKISGIAVDDIGWNDVGSWEAVYELAEKDGDGNAARGELLAEASRGNYVDAAKTVALLGVENLIVVDTPDALLIAKRNKAQEVSKLVKVLERQGREELL
ncbi:MAG: mannose-1-phosphate guanylyltransferase [Acidobacteriaceae bacterium]|nr:mannose-1-phosphate guanylyltransferase [Acidobacteriaceae bacterium]MBV9781753.1 mannose-1-phosphate guanylyltransferase [Acidobacteriaceae bacterium]